MTLTDLEPDAAKGGPSAPSQRPAVDAPGEDEVRAALARVLAGDEFASSPRLADFLRFIVGATLAGRAESIKGYTIAVEALGRPTSFDPQSDPIVRVEATRLRRALERYYASAGPDEPLEICVPKGGYVPAFRRRAGEVEPAPLPPPLPVAPAPPAAPGRSRRPWLVAAAIVVSAGVAFAAAGLQIGLEHGAKSLVLTVGGHPTTAADLADRIGLPVLEVERFETAGTPAPSLDEMHTLEVRLRDALARFDFVDVMAAGGGSARECSGSPPRPVFTLGGLAEGRPDGGYALLVRLSDRCGGTIVWSKELEGTAPTEGRAAGEMRIVQDVAASLVETHGALQARARAQARLEAPESGFGCLSRALASPNGVMTDPSEARACIERLAARDSSYGVFHSVKAAQMLEAMRVQAKAGSAPGPAEVAQARAELLREARLGVDLAPTSAYAAKVLADVDFHLGDREGALLAADRAVSLNPLDHHVAAAAGAVMVGLGRVEQGEALLLRARQNGAQLSEEHTIYLAIAAFLRNDSAAARNALPGLEGHDDPAAAIARALALHTLGRLEDERRVVSGLLRATAGGFETVQAIVRRLLPSGEEAVRVIGELESAALRAPPLAEGPSKG
ncbi:hypothetical protein [Aquabacter cavernae]|uniref:hypothetical protein n=1 Tax=Aquabacter cavernae TaxID=2496029 RepID=UPI000F8DBB07|nr:hypothetical protein [Aquabacter cavernae]